MLVYKQDSFTWPNARIANRPEEADICLLKSIEHDGRTIGGIKKDNWAFAKTDKPCVIYEHGLLSTRMLYYRMMLDIPNPPNLKAVLTWGQYSKDRLIEVGFPQDRIFVVGPIFLTKITKQNPVNEIGFVPVHDRWQNNDIVRKMILKISGNGYPKFFAKHLQGKDTMNEMENTHETNRLARCKAVISPVGFQTISAATMAAGIPTLLYKGEDPERWKGERRLNRFFLHELDRMKFLWFLTERDLKRRVAEALSGDQGEDRQEFLNHVCGHGIDTGKAIARSLEAIKNF